MTGRILHHNPKCVKFPPRSKIVIYVTRLQGADYTMTHATCQAYNNYGVSRHNRHNRPIGQIGHSPETYRTLVLIGHKGQILLFRV
jgi:hypothetical protein